MPKRKTTIALIVCAASLSNFLQPAYSQTTHLSDAQQSALKSLGIPVAVPSYIPEGFRVTQMSLKLCAADAPRIGDCREGSSYEIRYRNDKNACFNFYAIAGGVGGGYGEFAYRSQTQTLGKVIIEFGQLNGANKTPTPEQLRVPQPKLGSFPARLESPRTPYYSLQVEEEQYFCVKNTTITPLAIEKMLNSLVWLQ
ncbi:hypothetical protein V2H45_21255 [Tumidithrix elongata RA019]|uniref:Uncharacterized protein n=1 Tax=Tumidithrix elongata BACA0141 TaxID=2716417 RepID=A0AAW9Q706_9CYAN|nr:hypothetical protein [Tumidithrix elongata RA019]